jgi:hypothetical protein
LNFSLVCAARVYSSYHIVIIVIIIIIITIIKNSASNFTPDPQFPPPPNTSMTLLGRSRSLLESCRAFQEVHCHRPDVTSNPPAALATETCTSLYTRGLDTIAPNLRTRSCTPRSPKPNSASPDDGIEQWVKDNLPSHHRPRERVLSITSLSSSSSCELHTNTDVSDDEEGAQHETAQPSSLRSATRTIEHILRDVDTNLCRAAYMQCNGGTGSNGSSGEAAVPQQSSRKASHSSGKRKSRSDDRLSPNDNEEEGPNKRRRGSLATTEGSEAGPRFACPFYKHKPHRYRTRRTCPGPGWTTVHRMKEHLYRAHAQSIYCPRCYSMFDADTDLSTHLRSQDCQLSAPQPVEGIERETLKVLRKRSPALRLEEDKWRDVYRLLFPNVDETDIPSPCKLWVHQAIMSP